MVLVEKAMASHSSTLAWKIPWTEEPGRLQSMGSLRVRHDWATSLFFSPSCIGEGNGNRLQCSCLENPRDRGAWWAAVYGVAQSWTRLKRLSSSSSGLSGSMWNLCCAMWDLCSAWALPRGSTLLSSCGERAQLSHGMWNLSPPAGIEPTSPALEGEFLTTRPPGKSPTWLFNQSSSTFNSFTSLSRVWLCDPMDCSPLGSSVHGILQARILEWVAISFSRGSSRPRDQTQVSCIAGRCFNLWATREASYIGTPPQKILFEQWFLLLNFF